MTEMGKRWRASRARPGRVLGPQCGLRGGRWGDITWYAATALATMGAATGEHGEPLPGVT